MKAVQIDKYGGYEILEVRENVPNPKAGKGQVLVEVYAASINPFDWKVREGYMKEFMPLNFPVILGGDFAGVVKELGESINGFTVGDEVYGSANVFNGGSGSLAEFTSANSDNIALKPKNVSFEQAAALPLVGSSAIQALEEHMKLYKGAKILIHGGAGGIGHIAIQLAKLFGAYVITTVSREDFDYVKKLGADEVFNYKAENFEEKLNNLHAVFDTVGGEVSRKSIQVLKRGGILVSMAGQPDENLAKEYGIIAIGQGSKVNTDHLNRLRELVEEGKVKVNIDEVFPLDEVREAFKYQEKSHPRGKVVIRIKDI